MEAKGLALFGKSFHKEITDQTNGGGVVWYKVTSGKHELPLRSPSLIHSHSHLPQHINPHQHPHTPLQKQLFCLTTRSNRMTSSV